jgi:hypothetical protein
MAALGRQKAMPVIGYLSAFSPGSALTGGLDAFRKRLSEARYHFVTSSDYPVPLDCESYAETFSYIERRGPPKSLTDRTLHHNAQKLFGFAH